MIPATPFRSRTIQPFMWVPLPYPARSLQVCRMSIHVVQTARCGFRPHKCWSRSPTDAEASVLVRVIVGRRVNEQTVHVTEMLVKHEKGHNGLTPMGVDFDDACLHPSRCGFAVGLHHRRRQTAPFVVAHRAFEEAIGEAVTKPLEQRASRKLFLQNVRVASEHK
eukprot:7381115-Prymnesium_polylepis.2